MSEIEASIEPQEQQQKIPPSKYDIDENSLYYKLKEEKTHIIKEKIRHSIPLDGVDMDLIKLDLGKDECRRIIELFNDALKQKQHN